MASKIHDFSFLRGQTTFLFVHKILMYQQCYGKRWLGNFKFFMRINMNIWRNYMQNIKLTWEFARN